MSGVSVLGRLLRLRERKQRTYYRRSACRTWRGGPLAQGSATHGVRWQRSCRWSKVATGSPTNTAVCFSNSLKGVSNVRTACSLSQETLHAGLAAAATAGHLREDNRSARLGRSTRVGIVKEVSCPDFKSKQQSKGRACCPFYSSLHSVAAFDTRLRSSGPRPIG